MSDDPVNRQLVDAKKRVQNLLAEAELVKKKKLFSFRLDIAGKGFDAVKKKNLLDAAKYFKLYIKVLEEANGIQVGKLQPSYFLDIKEAREELLLISQIYWELVIIYDKAKTPEKVAEFKGYIEKFIIFSHKMPYQPFCAEKLRKHIALGKAMHMADFKNAHRVLGKNSCFLATALSDQLHPDTLLTLRCFRDMHLRHTSWGRKCIILYYRISPSLALWIKRCPSLVQKWVAALLDTIAFCVRFL